MVITKKVKLGQITLKIGSGATPRGGQESYKNKGISLIRSLNIYNFTFNDNGLAFIDQEQADKQGKRTHFFTFKEMGRRRLMSIIFPLT